MAPTADPYRDIAVIDERAPRFNQATIGLLGLVALATGWWAIVPVLAGQLILGLTLGRRFCLPCLFYFEVVQPRWGEGDLEDSRPPRFANVVGATFLSTATGSFVIGFEVLGWILTGLVAVFALLAASTGLCLGCELYRLIARWRGVRPGNVLAIEWAELGGRESQPMVVQFTHPLCSGCREMSDRLSNQGRAVHEIDVSERPELARKYHVAVVPTAMVVAPDGRVLETIR